MRRFARHYCSIKLNAGVSILEGIIGTAILIVMILASMQLVVHYMRVIRQATIDRAVIQAREFAYGNTNCFLTSKGQQAACAAGNYIAVASNDNRTPYKELFPAAGKTFNGFTTDAPPESVRFLLSLRASCHNEKDFYRLHFEYRLQNPNGSDVIDVLTDKDSPATKNHGVWSALFKNSAQDVNCNVPPSYTGGRWYGTTGEACALRCAAESKVNVPDPQGYRCISNNARSTNAFRELIGNPDTETNLDLGLSSGERGGPGFCYLYRHDSVPVIIDDSNPSNETRGCYCADG